MWARHAQPVSTTSPPTSCRSSACRASRTFAFAPQQVSASRLRLGARGDGKKRGGSRTESDRSKPLPGPAPVPYHVLRLGPTKPRVNHHLQVGHGRHVSRPFDNMWSLLRRTFAGAFVARSLRNVPSCISQTCQRCLFKLTTVTGSEWLDRGVSTRQISVPRWRRLREWRAIRCQYLW